MPATQKTGPAGSSICQKRAHVLVPLRAEALETGHLGRDVVGLDVDVPSGRGARAGALYLDVPPVGERPERRPLLVGGVRGRRPACGPGPERAARGMVLRR